jgi:hypothetical protein
LSEAFPELLPPKAPTLNRPVPLTQMEFMMGIKEHQDGHVTQTKEDSVVVENFFK